MTNPFDITVTAPARVDARRFAEEHGLEVSEIEAIADELMDSFKDGDRTHVIIKVVEREADDTPWVLAVYPDGDVYQTMVG